MGHRYGVGPKYVSAIETVDMYVGQLMEAVQDRPTYEEENWLMMFVTDHGHYDSGGARRSRAGDTYCSVSRPWPNGPRWQIPVHTKCV
jgi:hypothetical protein